MYIVQSLRFCSGDLLNDITNSKLYSVFGIVRYDRVPIVAVGDDCTNFTTRSSAKVPTMPSQDVRLSVYHTPVLCRNGNHQFFSHHTILIFCTKRYSNILTGTPFVRGRRMQVGYEKIAIFDQYLALSRK